MASTRTFSKERMSDGGSPSSRSMKKPTTLKAVLFDWDGTVVDTAESSFRCYMRMFERFGIAFDRETYGRTYSPNWYDTFRQVGLEEEHWPAADAAWLEHFAEETTELLPGAFEVLSSLHARGLIEGLVTSGSKSRVLRELDALGVAHLFKSVVCGQDTPQKKPHPAPLLLCLEQLGLEPADAVYIGDSAEDIQMAKAAHVFAIAVPGPYPNREALQRSGADLFADDLRGAIRMLDAGS